MDPKPSQISAGYCTVSRGWKETDLKEKNELDSRHSGGELSCEELPNITLCPISMGPRLTYPSRIPTL